MADMVKIDGNVFVPNQLPLTQPLASGPQLIQHFENDPLHQSLAAVLNQNNSGVQEMLKGKFKALGITQIVTGIIAIIIAIVGISILKVPNYMMISLEFGTPWWTGVLFIVAGALAIAVEKEPTQCMIRGCLSMNIISAIACLPAVIIYSINLNVNCQYSYYCSRPDGLIACLAILLLLTLLNAAISIAVSSFNCKAMNNCCATSVPVIVVYNSTSAQLVPQQQIHDNPPPYNVTAMENVHVG
ncbi:membrane-spanning 4-domains subfamily A member 8-like [Scyliorhinus canicula]|uniref:membrane-spanning 4-domains subfamily A member 8-like n=1 Tax=Scyliorhinus canicula TaxID=7830 RepID=UPI0018F5D0B5|nr:membrane-spanning 4-domains subfamily A member 8-like [Scyliorhinus canicula]XP_038671087.1 membrane-spanning 4-domains subfamily A member 8-like [Scyliorhinus canicula]